MGRPKKETKSENTKVMFMYVDQNLDREWREFCKEYGYSSAGAARAALKMYMKRMKTAEKVADTLIAEGE